MALEATHLRFALDCRDKNNVTNIGHYLAGAIYPDSRYLTKIDRQLTHNNDILRQDWADSDFKKGWQNHCWADELQKKARNELLGDFLALHDDGHRGIWIAATAIKIIADIDDCRNFDVADAVSRLEHVHNPHGEDEESICRYHQLVRETYLGADRGQLSAYERFWLDFGVDAGLVAQVIDLTKKSAADRPLVAKITGIYPLMLQLGSIK